MDSAIFARNDGFPTGLRVLVVDDDLTWLKILEKMLKKCFYQVTTCSLAKDALSILRERKDGFDIVISDVNMPDMDGFKLLELVGLEMDLPVIMMSVDGETSRVMKGVQHGACDYLLKPIRMKELRNIWQHVLRKRINNYDEAIQMISTQTLHNDTDVSATRKRKDAELGDAFAKRARVVWTVDLHQKFVKAVKLIGIERIGPKKILDSMNVPWLTRENVASHLQKYRLYLSRLQRANGDKPFEISNHLDVDFCRVKHSDVFTNDDPEGISFGTQETNSDKHMDGASSSNMYYDIQTKHTKSIKLMLPALKTELNGGLYADASEPRNKKTHHSESDGQFADPEPTSIPNFSWNEDIGVEHYYENATEQHQRIDDGFNHSPLRPQINNRKSFLSGQSSHSENGRMPPASMERDPSVYHLSPSVSADVVNSHLKREICRPLYAEQGTRGNLISGKVVIEHKFENTLNDAYPFGFQLHSVVCPGQEAVVHKLIQNHRNRFEPPEDSELALVAFGKDYKAELYQSDQASYNFYDSNETDLTASIPVHIFDALRYDWCSEAPSSGCPVMMDQSLSMLDNAHFSSSYYTVS